MRQYFIYLFISLLICTRAIAQNVGIVTTTPVTKLNIVGGSNDPAIPGLTSTGIFRIGVTAEEGIDFGKLSSSPYSAWMLAEYSGNTHISLQPLDGGVGVGTTAPHTSAALEVTSTTQNFLTPRMTSVQRDAIASPAEGLMISCTDCNIKGLHQYINGAWQTMTSSNTGNYGTVVNPVTGKVWHDRNLGASQIANTCSTDAASYGDLYQWGRNADGHQIRTSGTTATQSADFSTTNGLFITATSNWLSGANRTTEMWSDTAAENNPCPSGFRIPTAAEWEQERRTWSSNNTAGAMSSPLKLPMAGYRVGSNGLLNEVGSTGYYWSSSAVRNTNNSRRLFFNNSIAGMGSPNRALGLSVRCLKD